jgi:hypothetical protein
MGWAPSQLEPAQPMEHTHKTLLKHVERCEALLAIGG